MIEVTFISNKTRKEIFKLFILIFLAFLAWVLQVSVIDRVQLGNSVPNLLFLSSIFFGLTFGVTGGALFSLTSILLCSSVLYDHLFCFSYLLVGLTAGVFTKNVFLNDFILFLLLSFILTFPFEFLNGLQYSFTHQVPIFHQYYLISFNSAFLNLLFSPFIYLLLNFITNKLKLR